MSTAASFSCWGYWPSVCCIVGLWPAPLVDMMNVTIEQWIRAQCITDKRRSDGALRIMTLVDYFVAAPEIVLAGIDLRRSHHGPVHRGREARAITFWLSMLTLAGTVIRPRWIAPFVRTVITFTWQLRQRPAVADPEDFRRHRVSWVSRSCIRGITCGQRPAQGRVLSAGH